MGKCVLEPTHQSAEARPQVSRGPSPGVPGHAARGGARGFSLPPASPVSSLGRPHLSPEALVAQGVFQADE